MLLNIFHPLTAFALTSGPSQPEAMSFQPVGMTDMVDLSTGDFKYNIPLLDVDGYPINLNYQSGSGIDDEASWVGLGWNLNVGSINRQVRGIPDDFNGDEIITEHSVKKKVTIGGRLTAKVEFGGFGNVGGSLSLGVFSDSYTGIGAEVGANVGMSFSTANSGGLTAGMGLGVLSNTASGVDVSPYVSLSLQNKKTDDITTSSGLTTSLTYNTRSGIKSFSLSQSFKTGKTGVGYSRSLLSYNTDPILPKVQVPFKAEYESFSFDAGGAFQGLYIGAGATGYRNIRYVEKSPISNPSFGFLYADLGKDNPNALHDFIREKDNPVISELPNLAIPVHTPDLFSYNSQKSSGQFRLYRGGTGIYNDNMVVERTKAFSAGIEAGFGSYGHGGITVYDQTTTTATGKWTKENEYISKGDFQGYDKSKPLDEAVYFRSSDEKLIEDDFLASKLNKDNLMHIALDNKTAKASFVRGNSSTAVQPIKKDGRNLRKTNISYLTGKEASLGGLDKNINDYPFITSGDNMNNLNGAYFTPRFNETDKKNRENHISEITITDTDNGRQIYGIPVYNNKQEEYSFAIGKKLHNNNGGYSILPGTKNLTTLSLDGNNLLDHRKGVDEYYHVEHQAPYASSYLLTALLSPDYVDKTNDGISDDDLGSAIKFKYSKISKYCWRTPYAVNASTNSNDLSNHQKTVTVNRALLADPEDDKGSIIYGEKEIYYPHSIESQNYIAVFVTGDRDDALGVSDWQGAPDASVRQKYLKEIRLYSKAGNLKTLVKTVKFKYDYELCPNTPNSIATSESNPTLKKAKLTLKKVWFEYGKTAKAAHHPYEFTYHNGPDYESMATDRWGTYKSDADNLLGFSNEDFPYSTQTQISANQNVRAYQLSAIILPSGGKIEVGYESDDYAYVQDKRAATMQEIKAFLKEDGLVTNQLKDMRKLKIDLAEPPPGGMNAKEQTQWFKDFYLSGSNYIYTKALVTFATNNGLDEGCVDDYVSAYSKINSVTFPNQQEAIIDLETITDKETASALQFAAWQKMKNEYPRYAYPGYKNKVGAGDAGKAIKAAISAIVNAVGNLSELRENFYAKAKRKGYASLVNTGKSFVRLTTASRKKLGGGLRVKYIKINDEWQDFTNQTGENASYGQWYDYTTIENGKIISSGVATYEPSVGSDENPMRQPVFYSQKVKGGLSNLFELEAPFGESFFPAPSVGYSKVTVRDLKPSDNLESLGIMDPKDVTDFTPRTGSIVHEFYTAKDFPVKVSVSNLEKYEPETDQSYGLISSNSTSYMVLSQGYRVELNDMHGKPKSQQTLNKSGTEVSAVKYNYQVEDPNASSLTLNNNVNVVKENGDVINAVMGRGIEFFTDFREQEYVNSGVTRTPGFDVLNLFLIPIPIPHFYVSKNNEYKLFRSVSAVKVIQRQGILSSVLKTENGSSISTEKMAYDGLTGEPIVTRTQNEFKQFIYSVNIPAYWTYKMMGGAYQNLGLILRNVSTSGAYSEINDQYWKILREGDQLMNLSNGERYWVVNAREIIKFPTPPGGNIGNELILEFPSKILINEKGVLVTQLVNEDLKLIRSSYNNKLGNLAGTITCLENPIKNNYLPLITDADLSSYKILNASNVTYNSEWPLNGCGSNFVQVPHPTLPSSFFGLRPGYWHHYHNKGTRFYNYGDGTMYDLVSDTNHSLFDTRMTDVGVWSTDTHGSTLGENKQIGLAQPFIVPTTKTYFIGFAADDDITIWIDGTKLSDIIAFNTLAKWSILPITLSKGKHFIEVRGKNVPNSYPNYQDNPGIFATEIYDNTLSELQSPSPDLKLLFTTSIFRSFPLGAPFNARVYRMVDGVLESHHTYDSVYNPFLNGLLGNWRPAANYVYQSKRVGAQAQDGVKDLNISKNGYFEHFNFFSSLNSIAWVKTNQITLYDKYGQELENVDALNRYSAAKFDFNGQFPSVVANNARNREIYHTTFEDIVNNNQLNSCISDNYFQSTDSFLGADISQDSHTGNNSAIFKAGKTYVLKVKKYPASLTGAKYIRDNKYQFKLNSSPMGVYPNGFEPISDQKYIFSAWINDSNPSQKNVSFALVSKEKESNAQFYFQSSLDCIAIVEGWKLVRGEIDMSKIPGSDLVLSMTNSSGDFLIDDIRIYPQATLMKSYAYNNKTFKLMAELDENNFASFYEYDAEGQLVRVKKDTERGIVTLKETRAVYKKRNKPTP
jgi:hypothetical protein